MEQVDLENSAVSSSEDDSFEIVVMPVSPASEQSEDSLFSVLSVPSSVASGRESEPGSDSESEDSLSGSASGRSLRSVPASSGRSLGDGVRPKGPSVLTISPSTTNGCASSSQPSSSQPASFNQVNSNSASSASVVSSSDGIKCLDAMAGLSKGQRQRRRRAAVKAAAHEVLLGERTRDDASAGLTHAQKTQFDRVIRDATEVANAWALKIEKFDSSVPTDCPALTEEQLQARRKAAVKTAVKTVQAGLQTSAQATLGFTEAQNSSFDTAVGKKEGRRRRKAEVRAAVAAVSAGWQTLSEASAGLSVAQKHSLKQVLEVKSKRSPSAVTSSKLSEQQRKGRRDAAVKTAAEAVLVGTMKPDQATVGFTEAQMLQLSKQLLHATEQANTSGASAVQVIKLSKNQRKKLNRTRRHDADSKDSGTDDTESESGYSTDTTSTMSSQDAASAIYE